MKISMGWAIRFLVWSSFVVLTACGGGGGSAGKPIGVATTLTSTAASAVTLTQGQSAGYEIAGGREPYVVSSSNPSVVSASMSGANVFVSAIGFGTASVVVRDAMGATTQFAVTVGSGSSAAFFASTSTLNLSPGGAQSLSLGGGAAPYSISSSDTRVANVSLSGSTVTVNAGSAGTATLSARDALGATVKITVTVGSNGGVFYAAVPAMSLSPGGSQTFSLGGGEAPYSIASTDTRVANVSLSGSTVTVNAGSAGTATLSAQDALGATVKITVTVGSNGGVFYAAVPAMSLSPGGSQTFSLGGGEAPYSIASTDTRVANVSLSGSTVTVNAGSAGTATLSARDALGAIVWIAVTVNVGSGATLYASVSSLGLSPGETGNFTLGGGVAPYSIATSDVRISTASVTGSTVTVKAGSLGTSTLTARDSAGSVATVAVKVSASQNLFSDMPLTLSMSAGSSRTFKISGGVPPYSVASTDDRVVSATVGGTSLGLTAYKAGSAALTVTDAVGASLSPTTVTVDGSPVGAAGATALELVASANVLSANSSANVDLAVTVKDAANTGIPNQVVTFSASSGTLTGANPAPSTNASGTITGVRLSPGSDLSDRTIVVTAAAGTLTKSLSIPVQGTTLTLSGANSMLMGSSGTSYTVRATDAGGKAISGASIVWTSQNGNSLSATSTLTDAVGAASITLTPTVAGDDKLTVTGLGTSASLLFSVSNETLLFTSPTAGTELGVNLSHPVTVEYKVGGVVQSGKTISFSTTRGNLSAASAVTNASGLATVTVNSSTAGPVTLSAQFGASTRASLSTTFVATQTASIALQANPTAVLPNTGGASTNQSTLTALVRDASGNPVAKQSVNFTLSTDPSGGSLSQGTVVTDSNGIATTQFIAGPTSTAANGVQVQAALQSNSSLSSTAKLTVNGSALFITIGMSNTLTEVDAATYEKLMTVYLTDANGVAATGRNVTIALEPISYVKGLLKNYAPQPSPPTGLVSYLWGVDNTGTYGPTTCANEDLNFNGILEAGEDINGNGKIEPGIPVIVMPSNFATDASGMASFKLRYGKNYALWVNLNVKASSLVGGTESVKSIGYTLQMSANDAVLPGPANFYSPFGTATACSNSQ